MMDDEDDDDAVDSVDSMDSFSFVLLPWAHGPMGPQPEAAREKLLL